MSLQVYLNGAYLSQSEARVPIEDRGFLFGDGVYEVIKVYRGRPFRLQEHLDRLVRSARAIDLEMPADDLAAVAGRLLETNGLRDGDASIYIQITRGAVSPRTHHFPPTGTPPTVLVMARQLAPVPAELRARGAAAVTHPDLRWGRCDIKSVNLLPNVLAKQAAAAAGAWEAILVRDGIAMEGSSSNLFAVRHGQVLTHPLTHQILGGITRDAVLAHARALGQPVLERPVQLAELWEADEVFMTSTTMEVMPIVQIDGRTIGRGEPGPVARALYAALAAEAGTR